MDRFYKLFRCFLLFRLHDLNKQVEGLQKLMTEELKNKNEYDVSSHYHNC